MRKIIVAVLVCAACTRGHRDSSGFDALSTIPAAKPHPLRSPLLRTDVKQHLDERLGVPTFLQAVPRQAGPNLLAAEAAREHLATFAPLYGMTSDQAMSADLRALHDTGRGAIIARFGQSIAGVDVFRDELRVVMDRQKRVIALSGYLAREAAGATAATFQRGERDAVVSALAELGAATTVRDLGPRDGGYFAYGLDGGSARAKRVFFHLPGALEPAHYVEVSLAGTKPTYQSFVFSASDGRLLFQNDLVFYDQFTYRVWAENTTKLPFPGPQGRGGSPHPSGLLDGFQAPFIAPVDVPVENAFAAGSPRLATDPWLPAGSTSTVGNNADAYVDLRAPDGLSAGDFRATVTTPGVFAHTYDTTLSPDANNEQRMAAIQQLFYDVNFFHDWYYDAGFDEASGNAQQDNFGRGGLGGDRLLAEGQDFSGRDNSNMATPADGAPPRMQMFIFNANPLVAVQIQTPPADIAGNHEAAPAQFGPQGFTTQPATLVGTAPPDACGALTNPTAVAGHIALIDRGTCTFAAKVATAQAAGAIGAVIVNNGPGLAGMGGTDATITIPSVMVRQEFGATLHQKLQASVVVTATLQRQPQQPDRDGTIDNQIVAHEWGHMIQNRLIGNANGLTNVVGRGMAEGWADFHALLMTVKAEDAAVTANAPFSGVYAIAGYTSAGGANQGYYFGVRRVPYSTDFFKNSLRFRHIQDGVPPPTDPNGQPIPVAFWSTDDASAGGNSEFHNTGEVWASMLWECYAALLNDTTRLTFDQAQTRMKEYLVAAYKATPVLPTMLEARDALLSVAAANSQQDYELFVQAFAKRGAGTDATGPDRFSADNKGVVEGTIGQSAEADAQVVSVTPDDSTTALCGPADGALGAGEAGVLHVVVKSVGAVGLTGPTIEVLSPEPALVFSQTTPKTIGPVAPFATASADFPVTFAPGTAGLRAPLLQVRVTDPAMPGRTVQAVFLVPFNFQVAANQSATDDVEGPPQWTTGGEKDGFHVVQDDLAIDSHHWSSPDPGFQGSRFLLSPPIQVGAGNFTISFRHRFAFFQGLLNNGTVVGVDGGVVEVSTDGTNFTDLSTAYPGGRSVFVAGLGNPIEGRPAFVGQSDTYPNFITTTLDAGTRFAGQAVRVRFLIGSADFAGVPAFGWDIDDITFGGVANLPFSKRVGLRGTGCNRAPVAVARGPSTGAQHTSVSLDGSGSSDPDGDAIHARWVQASGPLATFDDATRLSPSVTLPRIRTDTTLAFNLFVDDGLLVGAPATVSLTAPGVNAKPVANAGPNQRVGPNTQVQLDGSGSSDPDSDAITYLWTQVGGPGVVLAQSTTANPTFVAPTSGAVVLQLIVSDGLLSSDPAQVTVQAAGGGGCGCTTNADLGSIVPSLALLAFAIGRRRRR